MQKLKNIIVRDFVFYKKQFILLSLAFALSSTIIGGALIIGDSLKFTLQKQLEYQLGSIKEAILPSDIFFSEDLFTEQFATPIIYSSVFASATPKTCHAKLIGVDKNFYENFYSISPSFLNGNNVFVNQAFADKLGLKQDDTFVIRQQAPSSIAGDSPFNSQNYISLKLKVQGIISEEHGGNFAFYANQRTPDNIFIDRDYYAKLLNSPNQANSFLTYNSTSNLTHLNQAFPLESLGYKLETIDNSNLKLFSSTRYFIENPVADILTKLDGSPLLTYLASDISYNNSTSSYAFISGCNTFPFTKQLADNEIVISSALTNQLNATIGDKIKLSWLSPDPGNRWQEYYHSFIIKNIIDINNIPKQFDQSKNIPGIGDADNCLDWQTDFPIDMEKIKTEDEEYWNQHKGLPKAFINYKMAKLMWRNELGNSSGVIGTFNETARKIQDQIVDNSNILTFVPIYDITSQSINKSTDFSQLFVGLSFILIASAIFFSLTLLSSYLVKRKQDIGIFIAMGYNQKIIKKIIETEILIITFIGVCLGVPIGFIYSKVLLFCITKVWTGTFSGGDIIFKANPLSIFITILLFIPIYLFCRKSTNKFIKTSSYNLIQQTPHIHSKKHSKITLVIGITTSIATVITFALSFYSNQEIFSFIAGTFLILALLSCLHLWISNKKRATTLTTKELELRNLHINSTKTIRYITSIALAAFMILSIGGYKTNLNISDKGQSSNAGYDLILKTAIPIKEYNINALLANIKGLTFLPIKTDSRSEADCSNVYNVTMPTIFGVPTEELIKSNTFDFKKLSSMTEGVSPWSLLNSDLGDDVIPAFADHNVLEWSLQLGIGDELEYVTPGKIYKIRFVGTLNRSIFQGGIVISTKNFIRINPTTQGITTFFIKTENDDNDSNALQNTSDEIIETLYKFGPQIETTESYLRTMAQTQDNYLAIFMALGYIALLIGLAGTNIIFLNNIEDNSTTIEFLREIGYPDRLVKRVISRENFFITFAGITIGTMASFVALAHNLSKLSWLSFIIMYLLLIAFTLLIHKAISRKI
ncbi:MAG: FtsX-like permease family protein [Kiritimatiellae bacterium]|jgi:putative ABC transport system permease protein|nr:FtsX-like permease family protein [Kiritimatiellia bacterium]